MKRKFLVDLGLEADVIDKIMAEYGISINAIQSISETHEDTIKDLQEKLEKFKGVDIDDLNSQIANLTKEKETIVINNAIETALNGVKHKELLKGQFDLSKIKLDKDGNVKGIDEQLTTIKENYKDFFEQGQTGQAQSGYIPANPEPPKQVDTYDNLINNATNMTAEQIAEAFNKI